MASPQNLDDESKIIVHKVAFTNADEASSLLSSSYAPVCIEHARGQFDIDISGVILPTMQLYRTTSQSGLEFRSVGHFDGFTFSTMHSGAAATRVGTRRNAIGQTSLHVADATTVERLSISENGLFSSFAIGVDALHRAIAARTGEDVSQRIAFDDIDLPGQLDTPIRALHDILYRGIVEDGYLATNPIAVRNIEEAMMSLILSGARHSFSALLDRGTIEPPRLVRLAIDYMEANAHRSISTADVARAVGVGLRTLQLSFQRWAEVTPNQYLRRIRLDRARFDLQKDGLVSISQVARRWGFLSPGEFARLYKIRFGELPTETAQRSKSR